MKWQDLILECSLGGSEWSSDEHRKRVLLALVMQIEENRIAIERLKREQEAHWPKWRDPGDA